jgi:hypothetical protein
MGLRKLNTPWCTHASQEAAKAVMTSSTALPSKLKPLPAVHVLLLHTAAAAGAKHQMAQPAMQS